MTNRPIERSRSEAASKSLKGSSATSKSEDAATPPSGRYVLYVVGLLGSVNAFNYMDRTALSVLLPSIKQDLHLSDAELGLLIGFAFSISYAICGLPIARWADRGVRRDIVSLALATWSLMTMLGGAVQGFWTLLLARAGVGAAESGCLPPSQSIICDYLPPERRPGAFSLHLFGGVTGGMLGMIFAGLLVETIGWRWAFVALGLPGIALALVVRLTLREPKRGTFDSPAAQEEAPVGFREALSVLRRSRTYMLLILFVALNAFISYGLTSWMPSFYGRIFGLTPAAIGLSFGIAYGLGSALGLLIGGASATAVAKRDVRYPLMLGSGAILLATPFYLASLLVPSSTLSLGLFLLATVLMNICHGPVIATLYGVTTPRIRATAGAISIFVTSGIGIGVGPYCIGLLSDQLAPAFGVESLRYAMLLPASMVVLLALVLLAASRQIPREPVIMAASMARFVEPQDGSA